MKALFQSFLCFFFLSSLLSSSTENNVSESLIELSQSMADLSRDRLWDLKGKEHKSLRTWLEYCHFVLSIGLVAKKDYATAAYYLDKNLFNYYTSYVRIKLPLPFKFELDPDNFKANQTLDDRFIKVLGTRLQMYNLYGIKSTGKRDAARFNFFLKLTEAQKNFLLELQNGARPLTTEIKSSFSMMNFMQNFRALGLCLYADKCANEQFELIADDTRSLDDLRIGGLNLQKYRALPSWFGAALFMAKQRSYRAKPLIQQAIIISARQIMLNEMTIAKKVRNPPVFPEFLTKNIYGALLRTELENYFSTLSAYLEALKNMIAHMKKESELELAGYEELPIDKEDDFFLALISTIHSSQLENIVNQINATDSKCLEHIATLLMTWLKMYRFTVKIFMDDQHLNAFKGFNKRDSFLSCSSELELWEKMFDCFEDSLITSHELGSTIHKWLIGQLYNTHLTLNFAKLAWAQHEKSYKPDILRNGRLTSCMNSYYDMLFWAEVVGDFPKLVGIDDVSTLSNAFRNFHDGRPFSQAMSADPYICKTLNKRYGLPCTCGGANAKSVGTANDVEDTDEENDSEGSSLVQEIETEVEGPKIAKDMGEINVAMKTLHISQSQSPALPPGKEQAKSIKIEFDVKKAAKETIRCVHAGTVSKREIEHHVNGPKAFPTKTIPRPHKNESNRTSKIAPDSSPEVSSEMNPSSSSNESEPDLGVEVINPSFLNFMLLKSDRKLLEKYDVRDILFAYLTIGNCVYVRYISKLLTYLKEWDIDLIDIFNNSPCKFFKTFLLFAEDQPKFAQEAMRVSEIQDIDFLENCVEFYERRLLVTHPYFPRLPSILKPAFKNFVAMLKRSKCHPHPTGSKLLNDIHWGGLLSLGPLGKMEAIFSDLMRPEGYPKAQSIEFTIALLALHEIGSKEYLYKACNFISTSTWNEIRNGVAHPRISASYLAGAKHIFMDTEHEYFLAFI